VPYKLNRPSRLSDKAKSSGIFEQTNDAGNVFSFRIRRRSNNETLFDTSMGAFIYSDQFIQIATKLSKNVNIYGFGENNHEKFKHDMNFKSWGIFARVNLYLKVSTLKCLTYIDQTYLLKSLSQSVIQSVSQN
jgi:hypothetical protein